MPALRRTCTAPGELLAGECGAHAFGERVRLAGVAAREQRDELVSAEAGDDVYVCGLAREQRRDLREHPIAHVVPELVVDRLEVVYVEHGDRDRRAPAASPRELHDRALFQAAAVGEPRERVHARFPGELREQPFVEASEAHHDRCDRAHRDHHLDPPARVAATGGQRQQRARMRESDRRDDRDRAAPAEEERHPDDRPHVEHGRVPGGGRAGEGVRDQQDTDRAERGERQARQSRPEGHEQRHDHRREHHGEDIQRRVARDEAGDQFVERSAAVHRRGGVGDQALVVGETLEGPVHTPRIGFCVAYASGGAPISTASRACAASTGLAGPRVRPTNRARRR